MNELSQLIREKACRIAESGSVNDSHMLRASARHLIEMAGYPAAMICEKAFGDPFEILQMDVWNNVIEALNDLCERLTSTQLKKQASLGRWLMGHSTKMRGIEDPMKLSNSFLLVYYSALCLVASIEEATAGTMGDNRMPGMGFSDSAIIYQLVTDRLISAGLISITNEPVDRELERLISFE